MTQLSLSSVNNRNLFSNHYLENVLPTLPEWSQEEHIQAYAKIKSIYQREGAFLTPQMKEAQIEERFFRPIFRSLRLEFEVQERVAETAEFPDYAFFKSRADLEVAHREGVSFYDRALAVGEVKRWETPLDSFRKDRYRRHKNPSFQIWLYLHQTKPKWGILSNGRKWRLYREGRPMDSYYEIDLVSLLETDDVEAFRYFYYFFRVEAFLPALDKPPFLTQVLEGSKDYAQEVGENLKENVYRALRILAQGFLDRPGNQLDPRNENHLVRVQQNAMGLLYRLLFVLYAEGRGLVGEPSYLESSYSLYKLKREIADKIDGGKPILPSGEAFWYRLKGLFDLIDRGSEASGIDRDEFYVPPYNGGLFEPDSNQFLETKAIGDRPLAEAIDLLTRAPSNGGPLGFVDYSTLDIRHLGSIYEGLLEYRIQVTSERMVAVGKRLLWTPYEEYARTRKNPKPFDSLAKENRAEAGELYVGTHKGERKASGSYYTPEPIVEFIVEHSLGPVVEQKWREARTSARPLRDATLSVRVLDPSMGSGHFLVGAIEFLARKLLEAIQSDLEQGYLTEEETIAWTPDWAKREVLAHSIYGVDLNELAVELAKVSLWLTTISKEKPLSFLDHRLKRGNSLMASWLKDLAFYPSELLSGGAGKVAANHEQTKLETTPFFDHLRSVVGQIDAIGDETRDDIEDKKRLFEGLRQSEEYLRIRDLADIRTGLFFSAMPSDSRNARRQYGNLTWAITTGDRSQWEREVGSGWRRRALKEAKERAFFHWELEFPDVFHGPDSGFDAVVGNPPYVSFGLGRVGKLEDVEDKYLRAAFPSSAEYKISTYALFMELAVRLSRDGGRQGLILPDSFLVGKYFSKVRSLLLSDTLVSFVHFGEDFWKTGDVGFPVIWIGEKGTPYPDDSHFLVIFAPSLELFVIGDVTERLHDRTQPMRNRRKRIRLFKDASVVSLVEKIERAQSVVSDLVSMHHGIRSRVGRDKIITRTAPTGDPRWKRGLVESNQVTRFNVEYRGDHILIDPKVLFKGGWDPEKIEECKILVRRTGDSIISAVDAEQYYHTNALIYGNAVVGDAARTLRYVCGIFNSRLFTYYYRAVTAKEGRTFPQVEIDSLEELRVPPLPTESEASDPLVDDAVNRLDVLLEEGQTAEACRLIQELHSGPRVVHHDLLVHLVEIIEEQLKLRDEASKSFLDWLEVASSSEIEVWNRKTVVRDFASRPFEDLVEVLRSNEENSRLRPHRNAEDLRALRQNFDAALSELRPLAERIETARILMDLIVYSLHDLMPEEMAIAEGITLETVCKRYSLPVGEIAQGSPPTETID